MNPPISIDVPMSGLGLSAPIPLAQTQYGGVLQVGGQYESVVASVLGVPIAGGANIDLTAHFGVNQITTAMPPTPIIPTIDGTAYSALIVDVTSLASGTVHFYFGLQPTS